MTRIKTGDPYLDEIMVRGIPVGRISKVLGHHDYGLTYKVNPGQRYIENGPSATELEVRARLQRENPVYTRCTETQIRAMLHSANPEWHDAALRREAEDRGMKSAPWAETKLADVLDFLRGKILGGTY